MNKPLYRPKVDTHLIESQYVDQTFEIHIAQPVMKKDGSEKFPVLYATDANMNFGALQAFSYSMQGTLIPRYILVGIGYPGDIDSSHAGILRERDLSLLPDPPRTEAVRKIKEILASQIESSEAPDMDSVNLHNGADNFLKFIRSELIPFIEKHYPVELNERAYYGYSAGARFGLYSLFNEPGTFNRYILGSPALSFFGQDVMFSQAHEFIKSGQALNANVFLSVGGKEQFEPAYAAVDFCSDHYKMAKILRAGNIPGLECTSKIFPDEVHATAWAPTFIHGVQAVFGSDG